jgi:hypothetical protein
METRLPDAHLHSQPQPAALGRAEEDLPEVKKLTMDKNAKFDHFTTIMVDWTLFWRYDVFLAQICFPHRASIQRSNFTS